ncbi:uncharacterized [Tachysurus ichikawai]
MRGASDPAAWLSGPQPIQYRLRSYTEITPEHTAQAHRDTGNNSPEAETLNKKLLRRRNKFSSFTFRADFPEMLGQMKLLFLMFPFYLAFYCV